MRAPADHVIGGKTYNITPMGVEEAIPVFLRLTKLVALAVGESVSRSGLDQLADLDLSELNLGGAIKILAANMGERETMDTIKALLDGRYVVRKAKDKKDEEDAGPVELDHFAGDYGQLFRVVGKVLEVNFGSFFADFKQALVKGIEKAKAKRTAKES